jgi:hypothetical protein
VRATFTWAAVAGVVGTGLLVLFFVDPATTSVYPTCMFHSLTGLDCPFCGTTRALHQLLHGNLALAVRLNPLAIVSLPLAAYLLARGEQGRVKPSWIWAALCVMAAFGVLRNVPVYPFTLVAP